LVRKNKTKPGTGDKRLKNLITGLKESTLPYTKKRRLVFGKFKFSG